MDKLDVSIIRKHRALERQYQAATERMSKRLAALKSKRAGRLSQIYLWRCCDFVKIGVTTDPKSRYHTANTSSPFPIDEICVFAGSEDDERWLHAFFRIWRRRGEWFEIGGELAEFVTAMAARNEPGGDPIKLREATDQWFLSRFGRRIAGRNQGRNIEWNDHFADDEKAVTGQSDGQL